MNTVTDPTELTPSVVSDRQDINDLRWFQTHRYVESGLLDTIPAKLVDDGFVQHSTYFGVYRDDQICATARIVRADSGLPMLAHHPLDPVIKDFLYGESGSVAEVSRLAVCRETQPYQALALLAREFLRFGLRHQDATLLIASVEKPLVRILGRMLGVPLKVIGPSIDQYGAFKGECVPILIDTIECLQNFRAQNSRNWDFFIEDLVLDITDNRAAGLAPSAAIQAVAS